MTAVVLNKVAIWREEIWDDKDKGREEESLYGKSIANKDFFTEFLFDTRGFENVEEIGFVATFTNKNIVVCFHLDCWGFDADFFLGSRVMIDLEKIFII